MRNFFSVGNMPVELNLNTGQVIGIIGKNGNGKCLDRYTQIQVDINNPEIKQKFLDFINATEKDTDSEGCRKNQ